MNNNKKFFIVVIISFLALSQFYAQESNIDFNNALDLQTCIEYAKKNHPLNNINKSSIGVSESQLKQAYSAYWPQVDLTASVSTMDESPNFIFPASKFEIPSLGLPGIELAPIDVPEQNVKLFDKTLVTGSIDLVYPLYTGGYISSLIGQAEGGLLIAKEEARKKELQIIADVKKRFYAVYIMQNLKSIGEETLARLETTLELTENLYLKGSGKVTKTDFLKNKILVENVRSINSSFKHNLHLAKEALLNALGEKIGRDIEVKLNDSDYLVNDFNYDELLNSAFKNNPTWKTL